MNGLIFSACGCAQLWVLMGFSYFMHAYLIMLFVFSIDGRLMMVF